MTGWNDDEKLRQVRRYEDRLVFWLVLLEVAAVVLAWVWFG
jgi:hypothetical protein